MSESIILKNILNVLKPYLNLNANELIFNQPCEINIDYGDHWEVVKDEKLDAKFLNSFYKTNSIKEKDLTIDNNFDNIYG